MGPFKAGSNLKKHGISFSDVEIAFYDQSAISIPDVGIATEERFILIGTEATARIVVVIYTYRGNSIRIISARKATKAERRTYEKGI